MFRSLLRGVISGHTERFINWHHRAGGSRKPAYCARSRATSATAVRPKSAQIHRQIPAVKRRTQSWNAAAADGRWIVDVDDSTPPRRSYQTRSSCLIWSLDRVLLHGTRRSQASGCGRIFG